jgi:hypothetical protein
MTTIIFLGGLVSGFFIGWMCVVLLTMPALKIA